jgi:hypothetical protein
LTYPDAEYATIDTGAGPDGLGGGLGRMVEGPDDVIVYVEVDDPEATLARIEAAGGTVVVPVTEVPGMVTFARFADPRGNVVGLVKA